MELNITTRSVYQTCSWFGFAPYTIKTNKRNQIIIDLQLNWWSSVYSIALVVFFCISIEYASLTDEPEGYSLR